MRWKKNTYKLISLQIINKNIDGLISPIKTQLIDYHPTIAKIYSLPETNKPGIL